MAGDEARDRFKVHFFQRSITIPNFLPRYTNWIWL